MSLSKLLRYLYDNEDSINGVAYYHNMAFHYLRKEENVSKSEASSILFLQDNRLCYRTTFDKESYIVYDSYGLNLHEDDVVYYNRDPKVLKQALGAFIKKLRNGEITDEFFGETYSNEKVKNKKETKMNKVLDKMIDANKESAVRSAKLEVGKTANQLVLEKLTPRLPMMVRGYADSPIAELIVGNVVAGLLMQFAPDNDKAQILSDAMISAGVQVAIESFDIPELVNDLLANVDISGLAE